MAGVVGVQWPESLRFEAAYGYGMLDRFDNTGGMHLIQTRVQLSIR